MTLCIVIIQQLSSIKLVAPNIESAKNVALWKNEHCAHTIFDGKMVKVL
jgi:hypothetical protein